MISTTDISVVIQGPVYGSKTDPFEKRWTRRCIDSARSHLPGCQIILSTWEGTDVSNLPVDKVLLNSDPGRFELPINGGMVANVNRQIVSTLAGLCAADRPYSLKLRSDLVLHGANFLQYFGVYKKRCLEWKVLKERVIVSTYLTQNPRKNIVPFNPSDWFYFGLTEDVINLWDIPLIAVPEETPDGLVYKDFHRYVPEQYLWVSFLRKYGEVELISGNDHNPATIELTELTFANNLIIIDNDDLPMESLKNRREIYDPSISFNFQEWLDIYMRYVLSAKFDNGAGLNGENFKSHRVALCVSGAPRFENDAFERLVRQISGFSCCDIFVYVWRTNEMEDLKALNRIKNVSSNAINIVKVVFADEYQAEVNHDYVCKNGTVVENVYKMFHAVKKCHKLAREYEKTSGISYDYFIRCRTDITLSVSVDVSECAEFAGQVNMPSNASDFGINDQMAIAPSDAMDVYANLFEFIEEYTQLPSPGILMNPEYLLKHHLEISQIPIHYGCYETIIHR